MPAPTPFDLKFRLFGIPVRVSPWFWLGTVLINLPAEGELRTLLIWISCVFFSILVHEFGHGLTAKIFGYHPEVVLHQFGGLCVYSAERQRPRERLAVLFMGPGAQFLLLGGVFLFGFLAWKINLAGDWLIVRWFILRYPPNAVDLANPKTQESIRMITELGTTRLITYLSMIEINLLWPLLNLLPIYPLDGGQITQVVLTQADRVHGARRTHIVSMVTAGILAVYFASRMGGPGEGGGGLFIVIFFGLFALVNFQALQAHHQHYVDNGPDDADWWKR